jgi:hypothetical protein
MGGVDQRLIFRSAPSPNGRGAWRASQPEEESDMSQPVEYTTVIVAANPDLDDCLSAAELEYIEQHPELRGYDLTPRWDDDGTRENVRLSVPTWSL